MRLVRRRSGRFRPRELGDRLVKIDLAGLGQELLVPAAEGSLQVGREPLVEVRVGAPWASSDLPVAALGETEEPGGLLGPTLVELGRSPQLERVARSVEVAEALGCLERLDR